MSLIDPDMSLDQFLLAAPEQRRLFDNLGITTCRDQNKSLAEACQQHSLDAHTVARLLTALRETPPPRPVVSLELMALSELCDHLEQTQRDYLQDELAQFDQLTRTAAKQLGAENPQLLRIRETFVAFRQQFAAHLQGETEGLFPLIRQLAAGEIGRLPKRSALKFRLARMEDEHNQADETLAELRTLAGDDSVRWPATRTVAEAVTRLDHAIQEQIYKENQVLFPRALVLGGS